MLDFLFSDSMIKILLYGVIGIIIIVPCTILAHKFDIMQAREKERHEKEMMKIELEKAGVMSRLEADYNKEMSNALVCQKCGAPLKGNVCEYCGASYLYKTTYMSDFTKKQ